MLWVKAFHIIFMVCWFAGLFYLPRLFVYHCMSEDSISNERFKIMERKLYFGIATPSAILTVTFGGWLLSMNWDYYRASYWMLCKLILVLILLAYHWQCGRYVKKFRTDQNNNSHVFYRWFNEAPVLLLITIILLAIIKPF